MPRGRQRKRLSRMDAAVDAMVPFGFPVEKVKKCVKELLQVYGGDSGWPFIEEYAYKELIDAMLRDVQGSDEEEVAEDENKSKDKPIEDESGAGTCSRISEPQQSEGPENNSPANIAGSSGAISEPKCSEFDTTSSGINNAGENKDGRSIHVPSKSRIPALPFLDRTPSLLPTNSRPPHRRVPCYGWIESDDEDVDDFVFLKPALREKADPPPKPGVKRRSRWDLRPEDP